MKRDENFYSRLLSLNNSVAYKAEGPDRKIVFISGACERLTGKSAGQLIGLSLNAFVHKQNLAKVSAAISGGTYSLEYRLMPEGGKALWALDKGMVTTDSEGGIMSEGIITDVSASRRARSSRRRFMAELAGGVRQPVSTMIGYLELSEDMLDEDDVIAGYLATAKRSATSVLRMLNDLSDMGILESRAESETEVFSLHELLRAMAESFTEAGRPVEVIYETGMSLCFRGDKARIQHIVSSLIEEASDRMQEGVVTVRAGIEGQDVAVTVADTAQPMTAKELKKLFMPSQVSGGRFAYAVCKRLAEIINAEISATSSESGNFIKLKISMRPETCEGGCKGTCFADSVPDGSRRFSRAFSILLADDTPENADLASIRLMHKGHRVDVVADGAEAFDCFQKNHYDAVLLDVNLPVFDGFSTARRIRSVHRKRYVPVIGMTAGRTTAVRQEAIESGMDGVFSKPLDFPALFAKLDSLVPAEAGFTVRHVSCVDDSGSELSVLDDFADVRAGVKLWGGGSMYLSALKEFASSYRGSAKVLAEMIPDDVTESYKYSRRVKNVISSLACDRLYNRIADIESWLFARDGDVALMMLKEYEEELDEFVKAVDSIDI